VTSTVRDAPAGEPRVRALGALRALSLGAPLVAITWLVLLARAFGRTIDARHVVLLAGACWLAYATDHVLDGLRGKRAGAPEAPRHRLARRHRRSFLVAGVAVVAATALAAIALLPAPRLAAGAGASLLVALYLLAAWRWPRAWRVRLPRELAIGVGFAAALGFALRGDGATLGLDEWAALAVWGMLGALNAFAVGAWERFYDGARGQPTLATRWPGLRSLVAPLALTLVVGFAGLASARGADGLGLVARAAALSAAAILLLDRVPHWGAARGALADLALLTPWLVLALA
jgi:hypothetical protein